MCVHVSLSLFFVFHPAGTSGDSCLAQRPLDVTVISVGLVGDHVNVGPQIKTKQYIFNIMS